MKSGIILDARRTGIVRIEARARFDSEWGVRRVVS